MGVASVIIALENKLLSDKSIPQFNSKIEFAGKTELKCIDYLDKIIEIINKEENVKEIF